ncbi:zinc finger protein 1035 [Pungitius pungitius]|uniref:zinc finger protein 1035 n=1 Tax=Pungitius pungitius TaxID=134920 RepID=UPI002E15DA46
MANGWDSYFHTLPTPSETSPLSRTSESEGSLTHHIENFIGHHDFPDTGISHGSSATNSNFNTNYYSNSSFQNPSSDCLYERYSNETPWQADGEQMVKDYLPRCGNSEISDFATDGLLTPGSFATDLQDCGMLAKSLLEDYSDVSSCSDADVGEKRPSCKFMAGNLVSKPKTHVTTKPSSSEWLFTDAGNMMVPTESLCPNKSDTNVAMLNVKAEETIVEMECRDKTVNSYIENNQSSITSNMVTSTVSKTVEEENGGGCPEREQKEDVDKDLIQEKSSNISTSSDEKFTDNESVNILTTLNNVQDNLVERVLRKIEESLNEETDYTNSNNNQDKNMPEDKQAESEVLRRESSLLEKETFDEKTTLNLNSTDSQDERIDCQEKEIPSYTNTLNNSDVESCLHISDTQVCSDPAVMSDGHFSKACDQTEERFASHSDPAIQLTSSSADSNPCLEKEWTSAAENTNSPDPVCSATSLLIDSNMNKQVVVAADVESCLKPSSSNRDLNPGVETESPPSSVPGCSDPALTGDTKEESCFNGLQHGSQSNPLNTGTTTSVERKLTSPAENINATSPQAPSQQGSPKAVEQGSLNGDVPENEAELFKKLNTAEEASLSGILYGEPLSRDDSSCDANESKLDISPYPDTSLPEPDRNSMNYSEGQAPQLMSSIELRKSLQPVVVLRTSEPANGEDNSYHCANCQHTTYNLHNLIEHHHCCHSVQNFQFCMTCNVYLMVRNEQSEKHVCCQTNDGPLLSSDSSLPTQKKRRGGHRCIRCRLVFSKLNEYIKHMRSHTGKTPYRCNACGLYFTQSCSMRRHKKIPGRCRGSKVRYSNADIKETKRPAQDDHPLSQPCPNLPECFVKLVDISKTHQSSIAEKFKNHFNNKNKGEDPAAESSLHTTKHSGERTPELDGKYKCPICPRLFKYSFNRARHLRDCVRNSMCEGKGKIAGKYQCPLCHVTFTLSSNRYRHVKSICLRECIIRLSQSRATSKEQLQQKTTNEIEQKTQSRKSEWKKRPRESAPALTSLQTVQRYKCNLCPAVFCHASGKYRHMKKHELFKLTGKMVRYRNSVSSTMTKPATLSSTIAEENETTGSVVLSCRFCGKCFNTPQSLKKHLRSHRGEKPYRCLECGKAFKKRANLIGHKIVHRRRIQCTVCQKIFPTVGDLIQHRSSHLKRGMLQCPDCPLQFQYPAHLLRHVDSHKRRENRTSQLRERPSLKPQESLESVKEPTGPKQLECSLCKEVFEDAQLLRKHCLAHISGSSLNQCPFCKADFSNRRYLLRHMIKHTGDAPFSCANCGRQFYRYLYLKLHGEKCLPAQTRNVTTIYSDTKKGTLVCLYCPRRFSRKNRLKNHHNGHKANTLRPCSRCGQCYGYTKLNHHQRNCTETSEFKNGLPLINGDVSESNSQARQNVPIMPQKSNGTRMLPLKCPHCTKRFKYRSLLLRHIVSHTGVQPYACMHCGQGYRNQSTCLQHEAFCDGIHKERSSKVKGTAATQLSKIDSLSETAPKPKAEGEVVLKCKFCTKTFVKSRSLRRHILTHNEVKPYRCRACDCCYSRYDYLKVHQTRCKGKKKRLEVCIPKISLDDIGKGWQNKSGMLAVDVKHEAFECKVCTRSFSAQSKLSRHVTMFHMTKLFKCTPCGSSFAHEKSLRKHRKKKRCKTISKESNASPPLETENVTTPLKGVRNRLIQRMQPYLSKKYKYACNYCPRAFQNAWQLDVHTRLHTGERPYACDDCGERFIRKDYVKRHSVKCTKERTIVMPTSRSTVFQNQQSPTKSTPEGFSCAYCSSRFLLFSQLQEHFLNAHKPETKGPPMSSSPLQHHLSNIPNIKKEPLDESCDKEFSDGATLIDTDSTVESKVPNLLSCQDCDASFANKAGLTSHLRVHSIGHPYNCITCKKGFWNKWLLHNHKKKCRFGHISKRSTTQQSHVPLKAEIDFVLNDSVLVFKEASESSGTGVLQTNFSCKDEVTDKSPDNSEEQVHSSSSNEKKAVQYQCSECDKSFTDGLMLISHLEDHGRQDQAKKRNACVECGQVFANQGNLVRHMKMHDDDRKFPCPECDKTFKNQSEVDIHQYSHDPNRSFTCRLCNQGFQKRQSLCDHYKDDHPDNMFTCRFCSKVYSVKKSLARHYRRWHRDEQRNLGRTAQEKSSTAQQSSSQVSTTGESDEDRNTGSEGSDSDSAPYFPCHVCGKTFPTSEGLEDHQLCHLGEKPHECAECGKCFFQASQLQQHERMHKSEYQCQACGRGFVTLFALRKHKHTHGKNRPYRCSKCDFSFAGPLKLAEHMSTHREENFPCDICNRVFPSKSSRVEHRKSHSKTSDCPLPLVREEHAMSASLSEGSWVSPKELKYRCGVCSERFKDPEELSEHGCMEAKERPHSCSDCDKHFLHASHLEKHRTTSHLSLSNRGYRCNQCNNSFSTSQHFLYHLKSHGVIAAELKQNTNATDVAQSNGFICPVCHLCFSNAAELMSHFPTHSDGTFECQICKVTFPSKSKLEEHECHHATSAKEFECKECDQRFWGKDSLKQHHCSHQKGTSKETEHSHPSAKTSEPPHYQTAGEEEEIDVTGEDFFKCSVCSIQFSSKSALLEHQNKWHPNEKTFKCKLCGKNFARRRYLVLHEKRHLQLLTFKCTQCHSTFNTAKELSLHMRSHAEKDVGKFRCDMCYKSFSESSDLKQHQESHVGQVVYECTECDKAFAFPHLLDEHQQTHAGSSV